MVQLQLSTMGYSQDPYIYSASSSFPADTIDPSSSIRSTSSDIPSQFEAMVRSDRRGGLPALQARGWEAAKTIGDGTHSFAPIVVSIMLITMLGNCLFRALAPQVKHRATNYKLLRGAVVNEMRINSMAYKPFMAVDPRRSSRLAGRRTFNSLDLSTPSEKELNGMFEARLDSMGQEGTWGDHLEIQAFCNSHSMSVVLFIELGGFEPLVFSPSTLVAEPEKTAALPATFLVYHSWQHYSAVRCTASADTMPATLAEFQCLSSPSSREATPAVSDAPSLTTASSIASASSSDSEEPPRRNKRGRRIIDDEDDEVEEQPKPKIKRIRLIVRGD